MNWTRLAGLTLLALLASGCDKIAPFVSDDLKESVCDRDGDNLLRQSAYCGGTDCDDSDASILSAPGWYLDVDRDTFGAGEIEYHCEQPEGYVAVDGDCDDTEALVSPEGVESCNDVDDDCDGQTDEENILTWWLDADSDGYGNPEAPLVICDQPAGYVDNDDDCDDTTDAISPDDEEVCDDGIDQNCDDLVDNATESLLWYMDADMDGFGDEDVWLYSCEDTVDGYVLDNQDCDDSNLDVHPDASEACADGIDNDCDGEIDTDAVDTDWFRDADSDGYGNPDDTLSDCAPPSGYVGNDQDCEDSLADVNPEGVEVCNDWLDNDCDGTPGDCDPLGEISSTDAQISLTGDMAYDTFGSATCSLDFNGDGFQDVAVGAESVDTNGSSSGAVYIFLGPVSTGLTAGDANITVDGPSSNAFFGSRLVCNPDMTGNGIDDLIIGAYGDSRVYILEGDSSLLGTEDIENIAAHTLTGSGLFGKGLATAGDVDADGLADLLIGAGENDTADTDAGAVYLILATDLSAGEQAASDVAYAAFLGETSSDNLGASVASVSDIDGDGLPDLLLGAPGSDLSGTDAGAGYLVLSTDLSSGSQSIGGVADATFTGESDDDALGSAVFDAGDTDGDGLSDLGLSAPYSDTGTSNAGSIYLISSTTLASGVQDVAGASATQLTGVGSDDRVGSGRFGAPGDLNGDGYSDILVGAHLNDSVSTSTGSAYLFYGPATSGTVSLADADLIVRGQSSYGELGNTVAFSPDVNGDGYDELLLGAQYEGGSSTGGVRVFYGGGY